MVQNTISHGLGQMRAQSLSIQVSDREKCNGGCLFCISRTTCNITNNTDGVRKCSEDRLCVGLNYAHHLGATHTILTSKADPTQEDPAYLLSLVSMARNYLPLVDIHTNGFLMLPSKPKHDLLEKLVKTGLTMITLSIASFNVEVNHHLMLLKESAAKLIPRARDLGLLVRCSLVMNRQGVSDFKGVMEYVKLSGELGAHMVIIREIWVPEVYGEYNQKVYQWNKENMIPVKPIQDEFIQVSQDRNNHYGLQQRDPLPWGTPVFAVGGIFSDKNHGVNVTFARCDEATTGTVIKSIIHKPDGHGYRNWDHNGDILY